MKATINCYGESFDLEIVVETYSNGQPALVAYIEETGERWGVISTHIPEANLVFGEVCIKTWSENKPWVEQVLNQLSEDLIDTGVVIETGFVRSPVYRISDRVLTEEGYDPIEAESLAFAQFVRRKLDL
jgi:hypothetical protein